MPTRLDCGSERSGGLPPDPNCERFYESDSRVCTVSARGLGRWRTYVARLAPLIAELEQAGALAGWQQSPVQAGSPQR